MKTNTFTYLQGRGIYANISEQFDDVFDFAPRALQEISDIIADVNQSQNTAFMPLIIVSHV